MAEQKTTAKAETTEKLVTIKLPLTKAEKDDVYVGVNGRTWLIQRGKEVKVPECVVEVLRHKEEMLMASYEYENRVAQDD